VRIFQSHGAHAKVSNIHVNGWFGNHDKLSTCRAYLSNEFGFNERQMRAQCAFIGDSPNDEPMFEFFPNSFAVANIREFLSRLKFKPAYIASHDEANGFVEVSEHLIELQR
jgi:hydroxymethylpyrimidine pyrophosphatase-like HAD family hydrolase